MPARRRPACGRRWPAGSTQFDRLSVAATLDRGQLDLGTVRAVGPAGTVAVAGAIDLPHDAAALHVTLSPGAPPPSAQGSREIGPPEIGLTLTRPPRPDTDADAGTGPTLPAGQAARTASAPVAPP